MGPPGRGIVHLIVASPDGRRVLARPNGLAGWTLPVVAVDRPFAGWGPADLAAAERVVGAPLAPVSEVEPGYWVLEVSARVPAAGRTWVAVDDADRLGADASAVRRWAAAGPLAPDGPSG